MSSHYEMHKKPKIARNINSKALTDDDDGEEDDYQSLFTQSNT